MARKRKSSRRAGRKRANSNLRPAGLQTWIQQIYETQTGRTIIAEVLVAAAGAAAAVLLSEKGRQGSLALANTAAHIADGAAKSVGLRKRSQHDLAEKALRMRKQVEFPSHPQEELPRGPRRGD